MYRTFSTVVPIVCACVLLTSACTSTGSPSSGQTPSAGTTEDVRLPDGAAIRVEGLGASTVTLNASPEQVWTALPAVYAALGIPAEINQPAAYTYGTNRFTGSRLNGKRITDFMRCGGSGAMPPTTYRIRLLVLSSVQPGTTPGTARLTTQVQGSATPVDGTSSAIVGCSSTGRLEQGIHTRILEHLAG